MVCYVPVLQFVTAFLCYMNYKTCKDNVMESMWTEEG
jgi:hypothetical protein